MAKPIGLTGDVEDRGACQEVVRNGAGQNVAPYLTLYLNVNGKSLEKL